MQNAIRKEHLYPHPIQEVWRAISNKEAISAWFITADFKAEVGYAYKFTHEQSGTIITGSVLEAQEPTTLAYTWIVNNDGVETTVRWNLSEEAGGTRLVLEHHGFAAYKDTAAKMFDSTGKGWDACIAELEKHLAGALA